MSVEITVRELLEWGNALPEDKLDYKFVYRVMHREEEPASTLDHATIIEHTFPVDAVLIKDSEKTIVFCDASSFSDLNID
jgi:hypothetical protein